MARNAVTHCIISFWSASAQSMPVMYSEIFIIFPFCHNCQILCWTSHVERRI